MFNAFLSGQIFALPEDNEIDHLELARNWSGQIVGSNVNQVCWQDLASVATAEYLPWYRPPPPSTVPVQNGIVSLGSEQGANFFAFISPLSGVSEAFTSAAVAFAQQRSAGRSSLIESVTLDLTTMVREHWDFISSRVRTVEGDDRDGSHLVITMRTPSIKKSIVIDYLETVNSIQIEIEDRQLTVDNNFNFQVEDVSAEFSQIASSITTTFELLKKYSIVNFHGALSYN